MAVLVPGQVRVDLEARRQTIAGFGGINFPRWIDDLTPSQTELAFGSGERQLGLSLLRVGIAPDSSKWPLELAVARRAKELGARVFASPWSPPSWMKTSDSLVKGSLRPEFQAAYAHHLASFVRFMSDSGAGLEAVSIQNEPDLEPDYEGCVWTAGQLRDFLKIHRDSLPVRVIATESMRYDKSYTDSLLLDSLACRALDVVGVHLYDAVPSPYPLAREKGKEIWMTEHYTSSDRGANLWPDALEVGKEIHASMTSGFSAYVWWYIRRFYGPITDDGVVSKRGWVLAHFSKFVRPGFHRIESPPDLPPGILFTAYRSDRRVVVVAINDNESQATISVELVGSGPEVASFRRWVTSATDDLRDAGALAVARGGLTLALPAKSISTLGSLDSLETAAAGALSRLPERGSRVLDLKGREVGWIQPGSGDSPASTAKALGLARGVYLAVGHGGRGDPERFVVP